MSSRNGFFVYSLSAKYRVFISAAPYRILIGNILIRCRALFQYVVKVQISSHPIFSNIKGIAYQKTMSLPLRRTGLNRKTPFFFSCVRCLRCCHHKKIQVNPYEIVRLAANRGISTAEFIERHTHESGTILNWEEGGACVFLDSQGCSIHPDRPLVCRLYPLGRHVLPSGEESFSEIEPDNDCKGVYGDSGMITAYLDSQGAFPFMEAADRYLDLFWRLYMILEKEAAVPEAQDAIVSVFQKFAGGERNGLNQT